MRKLLVIVTVLYVELCCTKQNRSHMMEAILDCYFDRVFCHFDRGSLFSRHKRAQVVEYLKTIIEGCTRAGNCSESEGVRQTILSVINYHKKFKAENGTVCLLGKYHNILYVGVRLCYDFRLDDSETVSILLREIFNCEKTFERIFAGAIFGVRVSHFVAGWKSDFDDQNENVSAILYFSEHATKSKLLFKTPSSFRRFLDVPMTSISNSSPLRIAAQINKPDVVLLLLRYGSLFEFDKGDGTSSSPLEPILKHLWDASQNSESYPKNTLEILKIFLRAVPSIGCLPPEELDPHNPEIDEKLLLHWKVIRDEIIPGNRSGTSPPELKHLCRCKIREILRRNWQLPSGIWKLRVPVSLSHYLDLLED